MILNVCVEPAFASSRCQQARPLLNVAPGADSKTSAAGSVSQMSTCLASTLDGTLRTILKVTVSPGPTVLGLAVLRT